jgi:hypothetical protein
MSSGISDPAFLKRARCIAITIPPDELAGADSKFGKKGICPQITFTTFYVARIHADTASGFEQENTPLPAVALWQPNQRRVTACGGQGTAVSVQREPAEVA